jgi:phage tail tape-measure protein
MKKEKKKKVEDQSSKDSTRRLEHEAGGGASGAVVGAIVGASAGPPGMVAGAIIGGVAGALAGKVLDQESAASEQRTREPNLKHPPPTGGAYSAASSGVRPAEDAPAEGPIQTPDP